METVMTPSDSCRLPNFYANFWYNSLGFLLCLLFYFLFNFLRFFFNLLLPLSSVRMVWSLSRLMRAIEREVCVAEELAVKCFWLFLWFGVLSVKKKWRVWWMIDNLWFIELPILFSNSHEIQLKFIVNLLVSYKLEVS